MLRAIFRFENLDSTKDLNDRFRGLFKKGIYAGGTVDTPVFSAGYNYAEVSSFSAMSEDGMAVISDSTIKVPLKNASSQYIVLIARYNLGADPTLELMSVTDPNAYTDAIKFCKIEGNSILYGKEDRDVLDPVSRNHYKGINEVEPSELLVAGDFYFQKNLETQEYDLVLQKADSKETFVSASVVENELNNHRINTITVPENVTIADGDSENSSNGFWNSPVVTKWDNDDHKSPEQIADGWEEFGSYHISINKWFALENINKKWQFNQDTEKWESSENNSVTFSQLIADGDYDLRGYDQQWNNNSLIKSQVPGLNNRAITQNYPLIPTTYEKEALRGNFNLDINKPGIGNEFLTKKTAGISRSVTSAGTVSADGGYYFYPIGNSSNLYIGNSNNISDPNLYMKYFGITLKNDTDAGSIHDISIVFKTSSQAGYNDLDSSVVSSNEPHYGRFLLTTASYYIKSPVELTGSIYFYEATDISNSEFSVITDTLYKPLVEVDNAYVNSKIMIKADSTSTSGALSVASNGKLVYSYNSSDNEVLLRDNYAKVSRLVSTGDVEGENITASNSFKLRFGVTLASIYLDSNNGEKLKFKAPNGNIYTIFLIKED